MQTVPAALPRRDHVIGPRAPGAPSRAAVLVGRAIVAEIEIRHGRAAEIPEIVGRLPRRGAGADSRSGCDAPASEGSSFDRVSAGTNRGVGYRGYA